MAQINRDFDERLRRIDDNHRTTARASTAQVRHDGQIKSKPRRRRTGLSPRGMLYVLAAVFLFKGFVHAHLGPDTYDDRVAGLAQGTIVEKAGAVVMHADPITQIVSQNIGPVLR